jgi:adenylate cyclase
MALSIQKPTGMVRRTERGTRIAAALIGAFLTAIVGYLALQRPGKSLVTASYDIPFIVHRPVTDKPVWIVYMESLDGESLNRRPQAQLLDKLGQAGAKAVVYDLIFDIPSKDPQVDQDFADAIRRFRGVDAAGKPIPGAPRRHVFLACGREKIDATGFAGEQLIPPIDLLLDAADDFGIVALDDESFVVRKLPAGSVDEPSMIWKAASLFNPNLQEKNRLQQRWLNFIGPPPDDKNVPAIPNFGANDLLGSVLDPGLFRDKFVVVGGKPGIIGEALGKDLFSTPFHQFQSSGKLALMSGVEVQATALSNLLEENWLTRSEYRFDLNTIIVAGLILGAALTFFRPINAIVIAIALVIVCICAGYASVHFQKIWFPWTVPAFAQVPVALVWGIASHSYIERFFRIKISAEQEAIRAAFAKYLSPQMLDRLTREGFNTNLGGEKIQAAMMFTDLESFTDMCERVGNPERIVETLNDYFERTTGSIFDHDGVVIKYIGDAIFAAWGAPIQDPEAPIKAVRAAWKLFKSDKLIIDGLELRTRIGIHYGDVVAGNIGSTKRVDYTMIGDAVNLAARLEGINKILETSILLSDAVHAHINGEFRTRQVGKFRVKGRKEAVVVYELLGPAIQETEPHWITLYHQAIRALNEDDAQKALEIFIAVDREREPRGDGPSRFFIDQIKAGNVIPGGIFEMKEK